MAFTVGGSLNITEIQDRIALKQSILDTFLPIVNISQGKVHIYNIIVHLYNNRCVIWNW